MPGPKLNEAPVRARRTGARGPGSRNVKATAKYVRISPYKVRVVLDLIRGHDVVEAANVLRFCERDAAITIGKVLQSAVANAGNNDDIPAEELYVSACYADEGPTIKRFRPRARGRTGAIRKRTSHITVVVSRLPDALLNEARNASAAAAENRARRTAGQRAAAEAETADARRAASGTTETVAGATLTSTASQEAEAAAASEELAPVPATPLFIAPEGAADDLTQIVGVGPKLAEELNGLGLSTIKQLSELSDDDLARIDEALPRGLDQITDWRTQAQALLSGAAAESDTTDNS